MRPATLVLVSFVIACVVLAPRARALAPDPAARGLDVYVHGPDRAAPGGTLSIALQAFGFATATRAAPLPGAVVEAGWDPETLGGAVPPPSVTTTADPTGRATVPLAVPRGPPGKLGLLVAVRHGTHARTRTFTVDRTAAVALELHTADTRVVPTSTISAWIRATGTAGEPVAGAVVEIALREGDAPRHTQRLTTDPGGLAMARVPIPRVDEPVWSWTLSAKADAPGAVATEVTLTPREETPGKPVLEAWWDAPRAGAKPGDKVPFSIRLRDATRQPLAARPLRYWIGVKDTRPPADADWENKFSSAVTDGGGLVTGTYDAPTLVKSTGTELVLYARARVEDHALDATSRAELGDAKPSVEITPEAASLVPGLVQRVLLTVSAGAGGGERVRGRFAVTGDGLAQEVTTNEHGEAELAWSVPAGIGAGREAGACASSVAAAVTVRPLEDIEALGRRRDPFGACVKVDRDAPGIVRVEPGVARPGEKVRVTLARRGGGGKGGASVMLRSRERAQASSAWIEGQPDGSIAGDVTIPEDAGGGIWEVSVVVPDASDASPAASAALLVAPRVIPALEVRRVGGRATPGGAIEVEARLTDGHGRGLPGTVSAVVVDAFGGGRADVAGSTREGGSAAPSASAAIAARRSSSAPRRPRRFGARGSPNSERRRSRRSAIPARAPARR